MIVMTILNDEDMGMIVHDSKQGVTAEKMLMFPKEALLLKYFIGFLDLSTAVIVFYRAFINKPASSSNNLELLRLHTLDSGKIPMKSDRLHI